MKVQGEIGFKDATYDVKYQYQDFGNNFKVVKISGETEVVMFEDNDPTVANLYWTGIVDACVEVGWTPV